MIRFSIYTKTPEKTLSRLVLSHMSFHKPEKNENGIAIYVSVTQYFVACKVLDTLGEKYRATPVGLFGTFWRYRKRWGLFSGMILCVFLFYLSTFFVWSVKIEGNREVSDSEILETLKAHGFYEGVLKKSVDTDEVELSFLSDRREFSFCSINVVGGVAFVKLAPRIETRFAEDEREPYNLVSSVDGVVVRLEVLNGQSMVEVGDTVHKGQLLVSGVIENTTNTVFRLRRAEGRIYARVIREEKFSVPLEYVEKKYTHEKEVTRLRVLGKGIGAHFYPKNSDYDIVTSIETPTLFGCDLPFSYEKVTYAFYSEEQKTLDEKKALVLAHDMYRAWASVELEGAVVENEEFSHTVEDGVLTLVCRTRAIEDIAQRTLINVE